ncbi:MAG: hypothetical protein ACYC2U_04065 [Candidatus Amoebophilus sp.]
MKKSLKLILVIGTLLFSALPSLAIEEEIKEGVGTEIGQKAGSIKNRVKSRLWNKAESYTRRGLKFLPWGGTIGDFIFGSEAEKSLEVQKEILETNQHTLKEIREMAQDALALKRKIEEMDRLRRRAISVGKAFSKTSFSKMGLVLGEKVLGISCNPGDYIPSTPYTRKLKRNLDIRYGGEKQFLRGSQQFLKSTRRAFSFKNKTYKSSRSFQKKLAHATAYDRHVEEYVSSKNVLLAQRYEELADRLLEANKELQAVMKDKKANMKPSEVLEAEHMIDENISKALSYKAKAASLLKENSGVSKNDKEKLSATEEHATCYELISGELYALRAREKPSWLRSSNKSPVKRFKKSNKFRRSK